jgi:hypothetical protein
MFLIALIGALCLGGALGFLACAVLSAGRCATCQMDAASGRTTFDLLEGADMHGTGSKT